jgi:hypothetical protein
MLFSSPVITRVVFTALIGVAALSDIAVQAAASAEFAFTMSVDNPPVAGRPFTITWVKGDYTGNLDILFNSFIKDGTANILTTSASIATGECLCSHALDLTI